MKAILKRDGVELELGYVAQGGYRARYSYTFKVDGVELCSGEDFSTFIRTSIKDAAVDLLGFMLVRPGDTDEEFFEKHTKEHLEFLESDPRVEELRLLVSDYESRENEEERYNAQILEDTIDVILGE